MIKIAIHSVPRSGSTWLGSIFDSHPKVAYRYQPLFSYSHKGMLTPNSSKKEIDTFFQDILNTTDDFVLQKDAINSGKIPSFPKEKPTHIVYKEVRYHHILANLLQKDQDIRIIGLIRNPFAVIHSWLNAPKEFRKDLGWNELEEWRFASKKNLDKPEEFNGFEKWKEVVMIFEDLENKFPERFKIVLYSDLIHQPAIQIKKIFQFCDLSIHKNTLAFLNTSEQTINNDAYSVFKSKNSDISWVNRLDKNIINEISEETKNSRFEKYCK